jgi:hypothetical protein
MTEHRELVGQLAAQTVGLLQTEYPNGIRLSMTGPIDQPIRPSAIYPAFYGCYDWHSSVHSHWQLVRAVRTYPDDAFTDEAATFLHNSLTTENIAVEMQWIADRPNFEMPYGMAWLLALSAELHEWDSADARSWRAALQPMELHANERFEQYCERLALPVRGGMHNQSAFSLGLVRDAAVSTGNHELQQLVDETARRLFVDDQNINLAYEPSAADFLSPSLAEAELLGRVLEPDEFRAWLETFVPAGFEAVTPVEVVDPSDGQLAHWAGLNLSRSWMLARIADALPSEDPGREALRRNAADHANAGLPMASHPEYMVSHWVPTFAIYLLTNQLSSPD